MIAPEVITIVVVNYNGVNHLPGCLKALARQSFPRSQFDVVVVDNASSDGSVELIRSQFPWVRLVPLRANVGFTGGNNLGVTFARGNRVALLNHDTIPDPHWLAELVRTADHSPNGQACSKLVFQSQPGTLNSTGLMLLRDGRGADRGFRHADRGQFERAESVFAGCAAAVLLRVSPRGETLFDPRLFLYCEDLERGWRDQLAGVGMVYAPRSVVRHAHGAAAGESSAIFRFYSERNRALVALRRGDGPLMMWTAMVLVGKLLIATTRAVRGDKSGWREVSVLSRAFASYLRHAPGVLVRRLFVVTRPRCG